MAIKSKLTKSIFIASLFHWGWLTFAFLFLDVFHIKDKLLDMGLDASDLNNLTLLDAQLYISITWFKTLAPLILLSAVIGYILAWGLAFLSDLNRTRRFRGYGEYRGLTVTLGTLPEPEKLEFENVEIKIPLNNFSTKHAAFIRDVLSLIYSHTVPAGVGHGDLTLFDHTLNVIDKAIDIKVTSPNSLSAIAAHDIGKVKTFIKEGDEWVIQGKHDEIGASLIAKLDSWWALDEDDRHIIYYAVKYSHKPELIPEVIHKREAIVKCVEDVRHVDHNVTGEEKEAVVEVIEEQQSLLDLFKQFLQETPLRTSNTANGQKAGGWIKHGHVFVLENYFKDNYLANTHPDVLAAYNELGKKVRFSKLTKELLKQLNDDGLLVKKWGDEKITKTSDALWVIKCGTVQFIKVIIVPLTEDIKDLVGHESYHKGLSVVSSFNRYIREQKKQHDTKKSTPKAKVGNKESIQAKVEKDAKELQNSSNSKNAQPNTDNSKQENKQTEEHNNKTQKAPQNSNQHKPNNKNQQSNRNKRRNNQRRKQHHQEPEAPLDYQDEMIESFLSPKKIVNLPLPLDFTKSFVEYCNIFKIKLPTKETKNTDTFSDLELEQLDSHDVPF